MYALFTLLAGACQSAMGSLNRMLTDYVGMFGMSLVVHAVGSILLILYMKLFVREKLKISGMPWYLYTAGILFDALMFHNISARKISGIVLIAAGIIWDNKVSHAPEQ